MKHTHWAIGTLVAAIGIGGQAGAVERQHSSFHGAVGACQAPLPSFEGAFRKRPLGIANEGGSTAFISCALPAQTIHSNGIDTLVVYFINRGGANVEVSCTLVDGLASPLGVPTFFPKVVTVTPHRERSSTWSAQRDNGGDRFITPSLSCAIPPGVEINTTQVIYDIDVGA